MKTAVCTVVIGKRYEALFEKFVLESWKRYCAANDYTLFVFRRPFQELPGKSLAWQKLLILEQPEVRSFAKVLWLDSDIIIKMGAPPLHVPSGRLGFVLEKSFTPCAVNWYAGFSLPPTEQVVQTGVLCLEPEHRPILEQAMHYPETTMYEMPALSFCISQSKTGYPLDPRFNALLGTLMLGYVPRWIVATKLLKETLWLVGYPPLRRAVRDVCRDNWFIHAAGAKRDLIKASAFLARHDSTLSRAVASATS
ncbi:MAG: hypothetical protein JO295_14480 [Verrucomicrobia bacterium]|nr:hypothetical protein [Verrucomicrobiota bacterium]